MSRGVSPADRQGRWRTGKNVRFLDGILVPLGGNQRLSENPISSPVRRIFPMRANDGTPRIALGTDAGIMMYEGSVISDISPADYVGVGEVNDGLPDGFGIGDFGDWDFGVPRQEGSAEYLVAWTLSLDAYGQDLLAMGSSDERLLHWSPSDPDELATVIEEAPTGRAMVVTPDRRVMIIGAAGDPRRVAWCSREDFTDWVSVPENTAGDFQIDTPGRLLAIQNVDGGQLIFADTEVWLVEPDAEFVYGRRRVGQAITLLSPNTVTSFGNVAIWMGKNGFWTYQAGICRPLPCEMSTAVFQDLHPIFGALYAHASTNGTTQEVHFFWPSADSTDGWCNRSITYNYADNIWYDGFPNRIAMTPTGVFPNPIAADQNGHLYQHEDGWTDAGLQREVYIESNAIPTEGQVAVLRAQMDSGHGYDSTRVWIIARQTREAVDMEFGPFLSNPDGRTPVRAGGQDPRVRIEATRDGPWGVGRMCVDAKLVGNR